MYYAISSMTFGGIMYFLGKFGILDQYFESKLHPQTQVKLF